MSVMLCSILGFLLGRYVRKCLVIVHSLTVLPALLQFSRSGNVRRTEKRIQFLELNQA